MVRIVVVGDRSESVRAHQALPRAIELARGEIEVGFQWIGTERLGKRLAGLPTSLAPLLEHAHGVWCVPGSPYASMEGALAAIAWARTSGTPFLGTCGGFQHAVIELARNVLGASEAEHAETAPDAPDRWITPLACSLVGAKGEIRWVPGTKLWALHDGVPSIEGYHCSYGLASDRRAALEAAGMRVAALDAAGEIRAVELDAHPFFVATLFQPELAAPEGRRSPIIAAFLSAAARAASAS